MEYDNKTRALALLATTPKGEARAKLLKNTSFRNAVLSSGANVTIYMGSVDYSADNVVQSLQNVYVGLIQRKNRHGNFDGLGALGGLAERTDRKKFDSLNKKEKSELVTAKDDVIMVENIPTLITDIDIIRKNNVLREMSEELANLDIFDISIQPDDLELIPMPKVKDDNYMINIWDGKGECYAITPYCHIYKDTSGIIDTIVQKGQEQEDGEVSEYKKIPLIEALGAYGNKGQNHRLEDGRSATKDYRYPHEYLTSWALASKLLENDDEKMVQLAIAVQRKNNHLISFNRIASATSQTMEDIAHILHIKPKTLAKMEECMNNVYKSRSNMQYMNNVNHSSHGI